MKYLKTLLIALLMIPALVWAAPVSWDGVVGSYLRPLPTFFNVAVFGPWFVATSTTQANTFPQASTTNTTVSGTLYLPSLSNGCAQITGGIVTSTGINCGSGSGSGATTTINGVSGPTFTFATGTATGIGLTISTSTGTVTFTPTVSSGYVIPLTASTTEWAAAYATSTALTPAYIRGLFSNTATGLTYNSTTGATSLTAGYNIPLTASTTEWTNFYNTPSTRITAGTGLSWAGNTLNSVWTASGNNIFNNNSANVGVGTTSPEAKLHVGGANDATNVVKIGTPSANAGAYVGFQVGAGVSAYKGSIGYDAGGQTMVFRTGSNITVNNASQERMVIDVNGNVGIGTTTPGQRLTVVGDMRLTGAFRDTSNASGTSGMILTSLGTGTSWVSTSTLATSLNAFVQNGNTFGAPAVLGTRDNNLLALMTNNLTRVRIDTNGNVNIGSSAGNSRLTVTASSTAGDQGTVEFRLGQNENNARDFIIRKDTSAPYGVQIIGAANSTTDAGFISFLTSDRAAGEKMRLTSNGILGIGTTTPGVGTILDAYGVIRGSVAANAAAFQIYDTTNGATTFNILGGSAAGGSVVRLQTLNTNGLTLETGGSERLRVTTSGNVGIGTTTPTTPLSVQSSSNTIYTTQIANGGGTAQGLIIRGGNTGSDASLLKVTDFNDSTPFFTVTDGNSYFQNGNVGIGTSTPAHPLQVYVSNSTTATPIASLKQNSTGDAGLMYLLDNANSFVTGMDNSDSDSFKVSYGSAGNAAFGSNDYLTITTAGLAGIGTTTPSARLHVVGTDTSTPFLKVGSSTQDVLTVSAATSTRFSVGTTTTLYNLNFQGTMGMWGLANQQTTDSLCIMSATGTVTYFNSNSCIASSIRFKENVLDSLVGLEAIRQLRPVSFDFKPGMGSEDNQLGLIAEEVAKVDPRLADYDKEGRPGTLDDFALISVLVKAVQELDAGAQARRTAEENWQWILIGLLGGAIVWQHRRIKKLENAINPG